MQTDFFSQQIATVATTTTTKMFLKLWTSVTLIFFPYDHWETSFSTFAKLVITLMLKPFQRYRYVTVELQRYLTLCGNKIMQMCKPGIQSVINTRNIIWKPRNKDIF